MFGVNNLGIATTWIQFENVTSPKAEEDDLFKGIRKARKKKKELWKIKFPA